MFIHGYGVLLGTFLLGLGLLRPVSADHKPASVRLRQRQHDQLKEAILSLKDDNDDVRPSMRAYAAKRGSFVTMRNGNLELEKQTFRFTGLNAPEILVLDDFEVGDIMQTFLSFGRRATRTYTLQVKGTSPDPNLKPHIFGWDARKGDWIYDENMFRRMDRALSIAAQYDVRLIFPIINADFGTVDTNWVGNHVDLVIHRKNPMWSYDTARANVDFFTDREMIDSYKKIVTFLLNRVNTVTGVRYGDDPTILAWQTGNELNYPDPLIPGRLGPPPGKWTDGSFARDHPPIKECYAIESLKSEYVQLFDFHYYTPEDLDRVEEESAYIRSFGKAFMVAEYGFMPRDRYPAFLADVERSTCSGSLIWSLRSHSSQGGFYTHSEYDDNFSFHVPGWPNPTTSSNWVKPVDWDPKEYSVVQGIYNSSFTINREKIPKNYPIPKAPQVWMNSNRSITWKGAGWASDYEVWVASTGRGRQNVKRKWERIASGVVDAVPSGTLAWPLPPGSAGSLRIRGKSLDGKPGEWSNVITI